ncbi:fibronectin type III domain-containing protein, partial [candidate division WOR-3 bacterium]|nr:fibronectin type III domain-containing protein [candidate division WOR-3 bacterium]
MKNLLKTTGFIFSLFIAFSASAYHPGPCEIGDAIYREGPSSLGYDLGHAGIFFYTEIGGGSGTIEILGEDHVVDMYGFDQFYNQGYWNVRSYSENYSGFLYWYEREALLARAKEIVDEGDWTYASRSGWKNTSTHTFRCDGLVEYLYEHVIGDGIGIIDDHNNWWECWPNKQFMHLGPACGVSPEFLSFTTSDPPLAGRTFLQVTVKDSASEYTPRNGSGISAVKFFAQFEGEGPQYMGRCDYLDGYWGYPPSPSQLVTAFGGPVCDAFDEPMAGIYTFYAEAFDWAGNTTEVFKVVDVLINLIVTDVTETSVSLSWTNYWKNNGFRIIRTHSGETICIPREKDVTSYIDNEVARGETYYYRVQALRSDGQWSSFSKEMVVDIPWL